MEAKISSQQRIGAFCPNFQAKSPVTSKTLDVDVECAVYMMTAGCRCLQRSGLGEVGLRSGAKTLTPRRDPPIGPRLLEMDKILNPRRA